MSKYLEIFALMSAGLWSCAQSENSTQQIASSDLERVDSKMVYKESISITTSRTTYIDTEFEYPDASGKDIIFQNSFPKGGAEFDGSRGYTDSSGTHYGYGLFWTRIVNETTTPLDIAMGFPADSFSISSSPRGHYKLFLPPDTMTLEKQDLYNYGITGLRVFLNERFYESSTLQRIIAPNEDFLFYVALLLHVPDNGTIRAGLVAEDQALYYSINIEPFGTTLIPCGHISIKN